MDQARIVMGLCWLWALFWIGVWAWTFTEDFQRLRP